MSEPTPPPQSGTLLSRYRLGEKLGQGGMGVVYRAFDTRLERSVALKLLPPEAVGDHDRRERFVREAKAASALHHAHIVTVFDIDRVATETGEVDLIAMELVDGEPLDRLLANLPEAGALPIARAVGLAVQMTDALAVAHKAGIVHRDVKPGNLMIGADGNLKLLDFGLSRFAPSGPVDALAPTVAHGLTTTGAIVGTPAYMSPEQAEGKPVGPAADVFAAGAVLYEMVTGRRPFVGDTQMGQLLSVLRETPPPLRTRRPEAPAELERIVTRCLEKDPAARYPSAVELHAELAELQRERFGARRSLAASLRRPAVAVPIAAALVALVAAGIWFARQRAAESAARARMAELEALFERSDFIGVYQLARELEGRLGEDRELERIRLASTLPVTIQSTPPGAQVAFRGYLERADAWKPLGTTPLERLRLPDTALLFRVEKLGFDVAEGLPFQEELEESHLVRFELTPAGTAPAGMVRIPAGSGGYPRATFELPAFWIGRHEVSNREFQRFVEAGGYRDRALWQEPFVQDGTTLPFDGATASFVDRTGRPGPATWELGTFPEGRADHPVAGVSWYEATAYARWANAELPTLHHWLRAAAPDLFSEILKVSNFDGAGTLPVGSRHGTGVYGTEDMAGNAFEWTSTHDVSGRVFIAGGAWNEPSYLFNEPGAVPPLDRSVNRGIRLARYDGEISAALRAPIEPQANRLTWQPVDDNVFEAFRSFYAYTRSDLHAAVDAIDDASPHFRWERVSFDAAYGGERIPAHLLLPKNARPPFQVVVYFPPSPAEKFASSQTLDGLPWFEFFVRGGRAVLFPIYQNTYERRIPGWQRSPAARRDVVVQWSKDLGRAIDYLETRSDIDRERIAFYGFSLGAVFGPVLTALEPRFRANIFLGGGISPANYLPEAYPVNFAPRVRAPTLMLTGKDDFARPVATLQEPLFRLLGPPADQKKLTRLDGGHVPTDRNGLIREALAWLDRWLGPVETVAR
jgi:hypothetical protein